MKQNDIIIRQERREDYRAVEELTREAFWNVYHPGCMEHFVLHCFRTDPAFIPELSLVMEKGGEIIGHVMYVRAALTLPDGSDLPIMTFGPISIAPVYKRQGYGKMLLEYSMERAAEMGCGALVTEGNILFYGKCGFVPAITKGIRYGEDPEAEYLIMRELTPGYLSGITGIYHDPAGYFVCQRFPEEFAAYEALFPHKEVLVLPG